MADRTLVVGVGNVSRRDDGLGWYAINAVRDRLGRRRLDELDDGMDDLGHDVDCVVVLQLTPELAEVAADYRRVVVVDARVAGEPGVTVEEASALQQGTRLLSHQFTAADLVSLCAALYGGRPDTYLVSARGDDYDFAVGLSPAMAELLPTVVMEVVGLLGAGAGIDTDCSLSAD